MLNVYSRGFLWMTAIDPWNLMFIDVQYLHGITTVKIGSLFYAIIVFYARNEIHVVSKY